MRRILPLVLALSFLTIASFALLSCTKQVSMPPPVSEACLSLVSLAEASSSCPPVTRPALAS